MRLSYLRLQNTALMCVAQLNGHHLMHQKAVDSIPSQSTCVGCGLKPPVGDV